MSIDGTSGRAKQKLFPDPVFLYACIVSVTFRRHTGGGVDGGGGGK